MKYDLIIIGADAAGLSAGIYAGRKKMNAVILTKTLGGQSLLTDRIENYPGFLKISGAELIQRMEEQVNKVGIKIEEGIIIEKIIKEDNGFLVVSGEKEFHALTLIIGTGSTWRPLNVPGEREFMGKGVSVCTICDAPFFDGKDVAVVGGGNSAFESAQDLLQYAKKIYVLQHSEKFTGDKVMFERLQKEEKIEFLTNAETKEIKGDKLVESLVYEELKTKETKELDVSGVFINIGRLPNSAFVESFVELNDRKEIIIDMRTNAASVPGVFAAGDVSNVKYKQSIVAASEGAKALLSAYDYLNHLQHRVNH